MIIEDKNKMRYLVWSCNKENILKSNKINCGDIICPRKTCEKCIFELNDVDLSEFKIIK